MEQTNNIPQTIYSPLSEIEFKEMKETMTGVGSYLPEHLMAYVWNKYKIISGNVSENQPCGCPSAASLWIKAVTTINDFIKSVEEKNV